MSGTLDFAIIDSASGSGHARQGRGPRTAQAVQAAVGAGQEVAVEHTDVQAGDPKHFGKLFELADVAKKINNPPNLYGLGIPLGRTPDALKRYRDLEQFDEILRRLDARNRVQAAVQATREGWV